MYQHHHQYVVLYVQDEASALWIAAQMGHSQVAKELLEAGAEVDAVREVGTDQNLHKY